MPKEVERVCEKCGEKFLTTNMVKRFCSTKCKPPPGTKFPPLTTDYILDKMGSGYTFQRIADEIGCSVGRIEKFCNKEGLSFRDRMPVEVGNKINDWTVSKKLRDENNQEMFECICKCSKIRIMSKMNLLYRDLSRCRDCYNQERRDNNPDYKACGDVNGSFFSVICRRAKAKDLELNITPEYLWELFLSQGKKCALTREDLVIPLRSKNSVRTRVGNASLDRIDPTKGYIIGNVQWLCLETNYAKYRSQQEDFIALCCKVADHYRSGNGPLHRIPYSASD